MGDPQDPLPLPCEHIYCLGCIKQWLSPGQMFCPLCLEPVSDDFPLFPSDEIRYIYILKRKCFVLHIALTLGRQTLNLVWEM